MSRLLFLVASLGHVSLFAASSPLYSCKLEVQNDSRFESFDFSFQPQQGVIGGVSFDTPDGKLGARVTTPGWWFTLSIALFDKSQFPSRQIAYAELQFDSLQEIPKRISLKTKEKPEEYQGAAATLRCVAP